MPNAWRVAQRRKLCCRWAGFVWLRGLGWKMPWNFYFLLHLGAGVRPRNGRELRAAPPRWGDWPQPEPHFSVVDFVCHARFARCARLHFSCMAIWWWKISSIFREVPLSHTVYSSDEHFQCLATNFIFIIQLWQERAHNNGQIMSDSLMLVLGDALLVVFLLGPKPFQLQSLLFRIRVSEAKKLLVI